MKKIEKTIKKEKKKNKTKKKRGSSSENRKGLGFLFETLIMDDVHMLCWLQSLPPIGRNDGFVEMGQRPLASHYLYTLGVPSSQPINTPSPFGSKRKKRRMKSRDEQVMKEDRRRLFMW